jgi:general secretion pathway protein C
MEFALEKLEGIARMAVNLAIVLSLAWVISLWGNLFINSYLGPEPVYHKKPAKTAKAPAQEDKTDYSAIVSRNIFSPTASRPTPAPKPKVIRRQPKPAVVPTVLNLKLVGTIISDQPENSKAVISKSDGREQKIYMVSDEVGKNAVIVAINRLEVLIDNAGRMETLSMKTEKGGLPRSGKRKTKFRIKRGGGATATGGGIREIGPGQYAIERPYFENQLKNISGLLVQIRAIPNRDKDGTVNGFKVFQIQQGSMFNKIGLKNNDVIRQINGQPLNSAETGLAMFSALKNETHFAIDLLRNNEKKTMVIDVE